MRQVIKCNKETRPESIRRFFIRDTIGEILAEGKSRWVLMDFAEKRATEAREYMWRLYGVKPETPPFALDMPYRMTEESCRTALQVVSSDIDIYGPVNNVVYARWICDAIGSSVPNGRNLKEFRIHYKKEAALNDEISLLSQIDPDSGVNTRHQFEKKDGTNLAYACTHWEEPR